jgi:hypothetical protein
MADPAAIHARTRLGGGGVAGDGLNDALVH